MIGIHGVRPVASLKPHGGPSSFTLHRACIHGVRPVASLKRLGLRHVGDVARCIHGVRPVASLKRGECRHATCPPSCIHGVRPVASLKHLQVQVPARRRRVHPRGPPRGLIEARRSGRRSGPRPMHPRGPPRGLIEARWRTAPSSGPARIHGVRPVASLKQEVLQPVLNDDPAGIHGVRPVASLKRVEPPSTTQRVVPHPRGPPRGLIEATASPSRATCSARASTGSAPWPH